VGGPPFWGEEVCWFAAPEALDVIAAAPIPSSGYVTLMIPEKTRKSQIMLALLTSIFTISRASLLRSVPPLFWNSRTRISLIVR